MKSQQRLTLLLILALAAILILNSMSATHTGWHFTRLETIILGAVTLFLGMSLVFVRQSRQLPKTTGITIVTASLAVLVALAAAYFLRTP